MSDTPETDEMVEQSFHRINFPTNPVPAEFARKLERERDEARKFLRQTQELCHEYLDAKITAERERDEAREEVRLLQAILDIIRKEAQ